MTYLLLLAGAFMSNSIPHLTAGLRGEPFPTPFASPPGIGDSSAIVNATWGAANLIAGIAILAWQAPPFAPNLQLLALAVGFAAMGLLLARHFGTTRRDRHDGSSARSDRAR